MKPMGWMEKRDAKFHFRDETQLSLCPIFFLLTDSPRGLRPEQVVKIEITVGLSGCESPTHISLCIWCTNWSLELY